MPGPEKESNSAPAPAFDESASTGENKKVATPRCGPVAQLGARFHGMEEVIGSIPIRSTNYINNLEAPPFADVVAFLSQIPKPFRGQALRSLLLGLNCGAVQAESR
jgi:hypothetical protein